MLRRKRDEEDQATELVKDAMEREKDVGFTAGCNCRKILERARRHGGNVVLPRACRQRRMGARRIQWTKKWEQRRTSSEHTENFSCDGVNRVSEETDEDGIQPVHRALLIILSTTFLLISLTQKTVLFCSKISNKTANSNSTVTLYSVTL